VFVLGIAGAISPATADTQQARSSTLRASTRNWWMRHEQDPVSLTFEFT
jgi:hypothetical protein